MRTLFALTCLFFAASCGHASGAAEAAILNAAVAGAASGIARAQGDCYSPCAPGSVCNPATGFCEPLPCRGQCGPGERCARSGPLGEHCVSARVGSDTQLLQPVQGDPTSDLPRASPPAPAMP